MGTLYTDAPAERLRKTYNLKRLPWEEAPLGIEGTLGFTPTMRCSLDLPLRELDNRALPLLAQGYHAAYVDDGRVVSFVPALGRHRIPLQELRRKPL